jgi:hypothetical protein
MAIEHWVGRQIAYFKKATATHHRRHRRASWVTRIAITMTFATSFLLAAMSLTYADSWHAWSQTAFVYLPWGWVPIETFIEHLQITVGLLAAFGIAAKGFLTRNADEELAKQYTAAREMFEKAERALHRMPPEALEAAAPDILAELGREAMLEQAEWLWLRHSRPFEALS